MTDYTAAEVLSMLAQHRLSGEQFDPEVIASDLSARTEMNNGLDELLAEEQRPDPTAFDPGWSE